MLPLVTVSVVTRLNNSKSEEKLKEQSRELIPVLF
jgi:hypothetical protein